MAEPNSDALAARLHRAEEELADLKARVDNAQQLANMGDYDWHIATDTNRWSAQLYRIYGYEPDAFNATYERFLGLLHPDDRDRIADLHRRAYESGEPYEMVERIVRPDGEVRYLASNGQVVRDDTGTPVRMRGTCIDITDRVLAEQERESAAVALREVQVRRRQALEINDNVVQGLTAAGYALEIGDIPAATAYLEKSIAGARHLMNDWLNPPDGRDLEAGDLVRTAGSTLDAPPEADPLIIDAEPLSRPRIVVVDDNDDVRRLLRVQIERLDAYDVVGEAADGQEAVEVVAALQPDVVFLDLAMPVMDGLEALPLLRQRAPDSRVIVLSGFDEATIGGKALAAGAVKYVEKGLRLDFRGIIEEALAS